MELTTQNKIIKLYKNNLILLLLALEDEYDLMDSLSIYLLIKKLEKIIDNMYIELEEIIINEIVDNINRNAKLLFDIAEIDKTLNKTTINSILKNINTKHSVLFQIKKNNMRLKNNVKQLLIKGIKNNEDLSEINKKLKSIVYNKVYGKTKGDGAKILRTFRTEYTRTRTQAKLEAIKELEKMGYKVKRKWLYTFESKVPRPSHLASDGLAENKNGYFVIDGHKTKGPGLFGIASQDINCRCDTECYIKRPPDN